MDSPHRETPGAAAAFKCYRDLGPGRTIRAAARAAGHAQTPGSWSRWAKRHEWARCAAEWDARVDDRTLDGCRESARARRRDWEPLAAELASVCRAELGAMSKGGMRITVGELCRMIRSGVAIEAMLEGAKAAQDRSGVDAVQRWAATLERIAQRQHGLRSDGALH